MLVATRGFGPDLITATVPSARLLASAGDQAIKRSYVYLSGDNHEVRQDYTCTTKRIGAATLTMFERSYATTRVQEICAGPEGSFTNDFWFQGGDNLRQSRQWISKELGHVVIQHLAG